MEKIMVTGVSASVEKSTFAKRFGRSFEN